MPESLENSVFSTFFPKQYTRATGKDGEYVQSHLDVIRGGPFEKVFEAHYRSKDKKSNKFNIQGKIYNFLERPAGWKCFVYHFSV